MHTILLGCSPFEVFFGRVSTGEFNSVLKKIVESGASKTPPACYIVGCKNILKKKSSGKGIKKQSRVVKGSIMKAKVAEGWYKVRYQLNGHYEEKWHSVTKITSLTTEENTRKRKGKHMLLTGFIVMNWYFLIL